MQNVAFQLVEILSGESKQALEARATSTRWTALGAAVASGQTEGMTILIETCRCVCVHGHGHGRSHGNRDVHVHVGVCAFIHCLGRLFTYVQSLQHQQLSHAHASSS